MRWTSNGKLASPRSRAMSYSYNRASSIMAGLSGNDVLGRKGKQEDEGRPSCVMRVPCRGMKRRALFSVVATGGVGLTVGFCGGHGSLAASSMSGAVARCPASHWALDPGELCGGRWGSVSGATVSRVGSGATAATQGWGEASSASQGWESLLGSAKGSRLMERETVAEESEDEFEEMKVDLGHRTLDHRLQVRLQKPLGLYLAEGSQGLMVSELAPNGNAARAGLKVGDRIVAVSATVGNKLWRAKSLDGVQSAISSRLALHDDIVLSIERPLRISGEDSISSRQVELFEVEVEKPLPLKLVQEGLDGGVYVKELLRQDTADLRRIQPYDRVVAVSASWGDQLWKTSSIEGVLSAVNTRFGSTIKLQLERSPEVSRLLKNMADTDAGREGVAKGGRDAVAADGVLTMGREQRVQYVNSQMATALRQRDAERAISVFKLAVERGISVDERCCTSLINAYAIKKDAEKALDVVRMMLELGMRPDIVTYNSVMNACEKAGRSDDVLRIFRNELPRRGLRPDIRSYTTVINLHGKRGQLKEALATFDEAVERGLAPELPAYTVVIKAAVKKNDMHTALVLLRRLFDSGLSPDVRLYNTLIWGHGRRKEWKKAVQILRLMEGKGVAPDILTFSYLLSCLVDSHQLSEAVVIYTEMREKHNIQPNVELYSIAIDMYAKRRDTKSAVDVFKEMRQRKVAPNLVTFTSLMEAFVRAGLPSAALSISDEMLKAGFRYDVASYVWRIKCYVELDDLEAVENTVHDMVSHGMQPNVVVYNEYLRGALKTQRLDLALKLLSTILEKYKANLQTHKYLNELAAIAKREERAESMEFPPSDVDRDDYSSSMTASSAVTAYTSFNNRDENFAAVWAAQTAAKAELRLLRLVTFYYRAIKLLRRSGVNVRADFYVSFLHTCLRAKRLDLAAEIMELRRSNRLQIYRLFKEYMEVVQQWEERMDGEIQRSFRTSGKLA